MKEQLYIVVLRYILDFKDVEPFVQEHRAYLDTQYAKGILITTGAQTPRTGGIFIAKATERAQIEALVHKDPFYIRHCAEFQIFQFTPTKYSAEFEVYLKSVGML